MSKRHPIDELFSQGLANSSASVPEDMWARIAKNRQKQTRKKILGWTTFSSLALGICVLAWWALEDNPSLGFFPLEEAFTAAANIADTQTIAQTDTDHTSLLPPVITQYPDAKQRVSAPLSTPPSVAKVMKTNATAHTLADALSPANDNTSDLTPLISIENIAATSPETTVLEMMNRGESIVTADNNPLVNEEIESSRVAGPHQRIRMGKVNQLPNRFFTLSDQLDLKLFANHAPRCADFANPFFHLDAELIGGPAYAHQLLTAKTSESAGHLQQRYDSEMARISTSASLRLAATSNTGLGLRSGFSYTQINEQFTHQVGSKIDVSITFGPNGQVIGRDTVYTEAYEEKSTNRLKFIEIPLLLGYERKVGKFRIGLNAGAYLNLFFDARGTVFSPATTEPIAFGQEGDLNRLPIFERSATAAWYGGLSFAYNLQSRYSLLAEPFFKSYPRALSSTGYDLSQNYWMTGLQVGLRMRL
jgi:hypothetical protein